MVVNYDSLLERFEPVPVVNEVEDQEVEDEQFIKYNKIFIIFQNIILIFYVIIKLGRRLERERRMGLLLNGWLTTTRKQHARLKSRKLLCLSKQRIF